MRHINLATVRYDKISNKVFEVSINISPKFRKIGLSKKILNLSEKEQIQNLLLKALYKKNLASIKLFKSCNYKTYKTNKSGFMNSIKIYKLNIRKGYLNKIHYL